MGVISAYPVHVQSVNEVERQVGLRQDNHNTSSYKATCNLERWYKYTKIRYSLIPRQVVGETAWQLTRVQTVHGNDVQEITTVPIQAMNIG